MANMGVMRARCYLILEGLERSIAENLMRNFDVDHASFLVADETERALQRLREDMQDSAWMASDVSTVDLLRYLDLGDLLGLSNRHRSAVRNARPSDIEGATKIIQDHGAHAIRKRVMHPVRPLEAGDYNALCAIAMKLPEEAPSLIWEPLIESISLIEDPRNIADAALPRFWLDDFRTVNNLPVAEFEDTGFIGRGDERRRLRQLILSDQRVITVVGAGGIGKTALTMRVCHDLLDDPSARFENLIWVSLKTQFLTADGIRSIQDSVDSQTMLLDHVADHSGAQRGSTSTVDWSPVLDQMSRHNTLLVIDNLETLGAELKELAFDIPQGSKLLLTSRVGLGEVERRFDMPAFSPKDSEALMRVLGATYGYSEIKELGHRALNRYCRRLHQNPLLIKWFVQAVGKGTSPREIFEREDFDEALSFCFSNVYQRLSPTAISVVNTLLAARRSLSQTQIRELIKVDRIDFDIALLELRQSNAIETSHRDDGSTLYQINGLILDYLSRNHPPSNDVVKKTREALRQWQLEQDRSTSAQNTYRYGRNYVLVETIDHRIAAASLREALRQINGRNGHGAETALQRALELTPDWSEVHRVKANVLKLQQRPIYEIENAFEDSIRYDDNDINRREYAAYLLSIGEIERALEQIDAALELGTGVENVLRSTRALALTRLSRISEALTDYEFVWSSRHLNQSQFDRMVQGTQYADALRRYVEQLNGQAKDEEASEALLDGIRIVDQTAADCGWDDKLTNVAIRLLAEKIDDANLRVDVSEQMLNAAAEWDSNESFVRACNLQKGLEQFSHRARLAEAMPNVSRTAQGADHQARFEGKVDRLLGDYGFIQCAQLGSVHMSATSLVEPGLWSELAVGDGVSFGVISRTRGLHAIRLEFDQMTPTT